MKILILTLLTFTQFSHAQSVCHSYYESEVSKLEKIIIPSRGGLLNTISSQIIVQPGLAVLGLFNPASLVAVGGVMAGTGTLYLSFRKRIRGLKEVLYYFDHHQDENFKLVKKVRKKLAKRGIDFNEFNDFLIDGMHSKKFCEFNYLKDKRTIFSLKRIIKSFE